MCAIFPFANNRRTQIRAIIRGFLTRFSSMFFLSAARIHLSGGNHRRLCHRHCPCSIPQRLTAPLANVRLVSGRIRLAKIHWYEAHGIGKREFKIKLPF